MADIGRDGVWVRGCGGVRLPIRPPLTLPVVVILVLALLGYFGTGSGLFGFLVIVAFLFVAYEFWTRRHIR